MIEEEKRPQKLVSNKASICPLIYDPCIGEDCINFAWYDNDGYCRYFQKCTNHDRREVKQND